MFRLDTHILFANFRILVHCILGMIWYMLLSTRFWKITFDIVKIDHVTTSSVYRVLYNISSTNNFLLFSCMPVLLTLSFIQVNEKLKVCICATD